MLIESFLNAAFIPGKYFPAAVILIAYFTFQFGVVVAHFTTNSNITLGEAVKSALVSAVMFLIAYQIGIASPLMILGCLYFALSSKNIQTRIIFLVPFVLVQVVFG